MRVWHEQTGNSGGESGAVRFEASARADEGRLRRDCARRPHGEAGTARLLDWVESQSQVTRIWLDQLIAEGDPNDLASLIHKQAAWLDLMHARLSEN